MVITQAPIEHKDFSIDDLECDEKKQEEEVQITTEPATKLPPHHVKPVLNPEEGRKSGDANDKKTNEYYLSMISKAGLGNIDADKVHQVIKEASKHSEFFKTEEEKLDAVRDKI